MICSREDGCLHETFNLVSDSFNVILLVFFLYLFVHAVLQKGHCLPTESHLCEILLNSSDWWDPLLGFELLGLSRTRDMRTHTHTNKQTYHWIELVVENNASKMDVTLKKLKNLMCWLHRRSLQAAKYVTRKHATVKLAFDHMDLMLSFQKFMSNFVIKSICFITYINYISDK